ncbi:hypothetical protein ABE527_10280 [Brucella sp. TWI432]
MSADAIKLRRIRSKIASLEGAQWFRSADERGEFVEAKTRNGELNEIARFHPGTLQEEIDFVVSAPEMVSFLLRLVDRAIKSARNNQEPQQQQTRRQHKREKDFAAEAAMKCDDAVFRAFLEERHGLERPLTPDRAAQRLRSILNIKTRKELNESSAAAERWQDFRAAFEVWKRVG